MSRPEADLGIEALREAFARTAEEGSPDRDHPSSERLFDAVHGKLPRDEVADIVEHTAECGACAESWRLAVELARDVVDPVVRPAERPARGALGAGWLAAAAVVVLAAGAAYFAGTFDRAPPPPDPGTSGGYRGTDSAIRSLVPEAASLPRDAFLLAWEPVEDAESYEVEVLAEDLTSLYVAERLAEPRVRVPAERFAGLPDGARLYWQVSAVGGSGGSTRSELFVVLLAGRVE